MLMNYLIAICNAMDWYEFLLIYDFSKLSHENTPKNTPKVDSGIPQKLSERR